ncbi:flagellar basal body-associated FliL family protein [Mesobaculum littorinae]|uniref:Flagellar basal body-associated FliL family protein n=1 Tax=Mesobaculum littorinae TaxID=2486419 RepID=A0A438AGZ7_9RHOB|nr:flagellar basal body-associated FliL family protein [Mesobaculum littorinae]RVV97964.1 flagellar basal body-associated FliL family protein [Mesobaculum littorinae]
MLGKLVPLVLALVGLGAGVGAGIALRPAPHDDVAAIGPCGDLGPEAVTQVAEAVEEPPAPDPTTEFVDLSNQFVVPDIEDGAVSALVVVTLSLEVAQGMSEVVLAREPKVRDAFLRVLLDHANAGGFRGAFTANGTMERLRAALTEVAIAELGDPLRDVLILDINRQEMT